MDYKTAQGQVAGQVDPLFNRAIQGVNQQKYQSDVQAGQVAAARGLGHSGLAADQLNKIAIAAQGQVGDLNAQRATQIATQANDLVWRDKEFGLQDRAQKYSEYNSDRGYNYQAGRDKIGDQRYQSEWNYNVGRDKISDKRYTDETNYSHNRDKVDDAWREKEWSQMSPAEKARMALQYSYSKKASSSGRRGSNSSSRRRSSSSSSSSSKSAASTNAKNKTSKTNKTSQSALDTYYSSPAIQAAEKAKKTNPDARKYLNSPTPPAQSPYLTAWEKKKMLGL
jgi:hypothetical protein